MPGKISKFARTLKILAHGLSIALASFFLLALAPTDPFGEAGGRRDQIHEADAATIKIYSFLSRKGSFDHDSAWSISEAILEESKKQSLDPLLILAVIEVESRFRPTAVSARGARGLMQIRPDVAAALADAADIENWAGKNSLDDPVINIRLGIFYLSQLKQSFKDLKLALTAYNLGPTALKSRMEEQGPIPFDYARKVLSIHRIYKNQHSQMQKSMQA
ncbi:MAG TPA: lytic transglycosylase domain-containing protein [Candidatus Binatia bacterium]|jgi:soluble lytic murein transglycosylase-like protein|nr:lytic transglycosylase domain-containing protein [Candidatus Binatia bacterium]